MRERLCTKNHLHYLFSPFVKTGISNTERCICCQVFVICRCFSCLEQSLFINFNSRHTPHWHFFFSEVFVFRSGVPLFRYNTFLAESTTSLDIIMKQTAKTQRPDFRNDCNGFVYNQRHNGQNTIRVVLAKVAWDGGRSLLDPQAFTLFVLSSWYGLNLVLRNKASAKSEKQPYKTARAKANRKYTKSVHALIWRTECRFSAVGMISGVSVSRKDLVFPI